MKCKDCKWYSNEGAADEEIEQTELDYVKRIKKWGKEELKAIEDYDKKLGEMTFLGKLLNIIPYLVTQKIPSYSIPFKVEVCTCNPEIVDIYGDRDECSLFARGLEI
ncbi:hypothetical protein KAR91_40690 [Candidatus Pacearchaeota archaeon]|nr:hypothetical protein [Candidatus Pacearchaeota archaeon]